MRRYTEEVEEAMRKMYKELNEKDRRLYIASEYVKLGSGSKSYICNLFSCGYHTLQRGLLELKEGTGLPKGRIRKAGGGRKKK